MGKAWNDCIKCGTDVQVYATGDIEYHGTYDKPICDDCYEEMAPHCYSCTCCGENE